MLGATELLSHTTEPHTLKAVLCDLRSPAMRSLCTAIGDQTPSLCPEKNLCSTKPQHSLINKYNKKEKRSGIRGALLGASAAAQMVKNLPAMRET